MKYHIRDEHERETAMADLRAAALPSRMELHEGEEPLTARQRRTVYLWYTEAAAQWPGMDARDVRRHCKLTIGIPLLNRVSETHAYAYNHGVKRTLTYEQKLILMDCWPVLGSEYMTKAGAVEYLDGIWNFCVKDRGWRLTDPGAPAVLRGVA